MVPTDAFKLFKIHPLGSDGSCRARRKREGDTTKNPLWPPLTFIMLLGYLSRNKLQSIFRQDGLVYAAKKNQK